MTTRVPRGRMTREEICSSLSMGAADEVIVLANECAGLADGLMVTRPPTVGSVVTQVREPIAGERFILADVLACRAEVNLRGCAGWGMRMGDDKKATLAAAICDAEVQSDGPLASRIHDYCAEVEERRVKERAIEWERLAPSIVEFEEIP